MPTTWHQGPKVLLSPELIQAFGERARQWDDPQGNEHLLWHGRMDHGRVPILQYKGVSYAAAKVAWNVKVGIPVGRLLRAYWSCPYPACVSPDHYEDEVSRTLRRAEEARRRREERCGHRDELEGLREAQVALQERVEELEEQLAAYNVRLTGTLIKPNPGAPEYILWSDRTDTPKALFASRGEARKYGLPTRKIRRAYATGSSDVSGAWSWTDPDLTVLFDQRGLIHRAHLLDFCRKYFAEDESCWAYLRPLDEEP